MDARIIGTAVFGGILVLYFGYKLIKGRKKKSQETEKPEENEETEEEDAEEETDDEESEAESESGEEDEK